MVISLLRGAGGTLGASTTDTSEGSDLRCTAAMPEFRKPARLRLKLVSLGAAGTSEVTARCSASHLNHDSSFNNWARGGMRTSVEHDWRRADRSDPTVMLTVTIGVVIAAALASLV
jgi:hypothetical protein